MENLIATYQTALLALGTLTFAIVIQSFIAGLVKNGISGQPAGVDVAGDISDSTFRIARTHLNSIENFSALFAASILAMMAGANVQWLTGLVLVVVGLRLIYWPIYYTRFGKDGGGLRSFVHVFALVANMGIAGLALYAIMY